MTFLGPDTRKRDAHESLIRSVVDFAREVRIHLRDAQVVFGSISQATSQIGFFRIQPWGFKQAVNIRFADVSVAAPVKHMGWTRHRAIATAQHAGLFASAREVEK